MPVEKNYFFFIQNVVLLVILIATFMGKNQNYTFLSLIMDEILFVQS